MVNKTKGGPAPFPREKGVGRGHGGRGTALRLGLVLALAGGACPAAARDAADLARLSLEELTQLEVTSVAKRPQSLSQAPAAVYVIGREDIRRSGATTLPEALRLAPNLHVARLDPLNYSITARGFGGLENANKLLAMVDGRSIYTALHSGVFWDVQNVMLEDLERVEVVSGPGGTLWGANAVNGVINVISRDSRDTQGFLASGVLGTDQRQLSARFGGRAGRHGGYRAYAMGFQRERPGGSVGVLRKDDWDGAQAGFRTDWGGGDDTLTVQGDGYYSGTVVRVPALGASVVQELWGGNLLGRWVRQRADGGRLEVQGYVDLTHRDKDGTLEDVETYDLSFTNALGQGGWYQVVWGGGHRQIRDDFRNTFNPFVLDPRKRWLSVSNGFAQVDLELAPDLRLTLGLKLEHSSFSGLEYLPNARLAWQAGQDTLLWAAVSRAVRTPNRIDRELVFPGVLVKGGMDSESLVAVEAGYRGMPWPGATLSLSGFLNFYDDLRATEFGPGAPLPVAFRNGIEGRSYGLEAWGDQAVTGWWRLSAGLFLLREDFRLKGGRLDRANLSSTGNDPDYQVQVGSRMDLTPDLALDLRFRAVGELPRPKVSAYRALDLRVGWTVAEGVELSLTGSDLLGGNHSEMSAPPDRQYVEPQVRLGLRVGF